MHACTHLSAGISRRTTHAEPSAKATALALGLRRAQGAVWGGESGIEGFLQADSMWAGWVQHAVGGG